jgi:hypothetical protein
MRATEAGDAEDERGDRREQDRRHSRRRSSLPQLSAAALDCGATRSPTNANQQEPGADDTTDARDDGSHREDIHPPRDAAEEESTSDENQHTRDRPRGNDIKEFGDRLAAPFALCSPVEPGEDGASRHCDDDHLDAKHPSLLCWNRNDETDQQDDPE